MHGFFWKIFFKMRHSSRMFPLFCECLFTKNNSPLKYFFPNAPFFTNVIHFLLICFNYGFSWNDFLNKEGPSPSQFCIARFLLKDFSEIRNWSIQKISPARITWLVILTHFITNFCRYCEFFTSLVILTGAIILQIGF